ECHAVVEREVVDGRRPGGGGCASGCRICSERKLHSIVIECKRRDGRAVGPLQVVPTPRLPVRLIDKEAVIADHVAGDSADAGLLNLLREQVENREGIRRGGCGGCGRWRCCAGLLIRINPGAQRWVSYAEEDEIAIERAACVDVAIGDNVGGPGEG